MNRKTIINSGLQFTPVWFEDRSLTSPDYLQISEFPSRLTAGKNLFKLRGHPNSLRVGGILNIEILDYNGNPIYFEVLNYLDDDKSRVIAIYIYEDTAAGDCTITIVAEAVNVPSIWQRLPNVKWSRSISVNPQITNDSEIIFEVIPEITISEQIGPHLNRVYDGLLQFPTQTAGVVKYISYNGQSAIELSGSIFTKDMVNGTLTVNTPINPTPPAPYTISTTAFNTTIKKVLSPTLALLDTGYEVYTSSSLASHTYTAFDASSYSLLYETTPTYVETQNSESYALVEIKGLQPSTGDVSRVKLFMNNNGTVGAWELINDVELTETEIFVASTSSIYPDTSIGLFTSQSIINTYWEAHTYQGRIETTPPTLTQTTASLNDALQIVNAIDISAKNAVSVAQIKSSYNGLFVNKSEYKITFDALGTKDIYDTAVLSIYVSGSAFTLDYTDYLNQELPVYLGKRIGQLTSNGTNRRFDDTVFSFIADYTGTGTLLFVVESGDWQISDIHTTSDNKIGYTPNYSRIKTLVPTIHKSNNQISFKTEYYNVAGVKSKQISAVYNKLWEGGNRYIDGEYSMLTGSLYVADSLNSGIAISGNKNTGFIRSLGYAGFYAGFPGFLLWSGSALSGSGGTKGGSAYSGVGLEMYANSSNYFRYSTTDNELDIRTNKIFIGNASTFISASDGKLQISSSNFNISAEGDVTASNAYIRGSAKADFFQWKNTTYEYQTPSVASLVSTYTYDSKQYACLNLTGSHVGESISVATPAMFIRLNNLPTGSSGHSIPLAAIIIHATSIGYVNYGGMVILETVGSYPAAPVGNILIQAGTNEGEATGMPDANIGYDSDDWYYGKLKTVIRNGITYSNVLEVPSGARLLLTQGQEDWRIMFSTKTLL